MGQLRETLTDPEEITEDETVRDLDAAARARRHRPASEIRFPSSSSSSGAVREPLDTPPHGSAAFGLAPGAITDETRIALWETIHASLFQPHEDFDVWTNGVAGRPSVRRIWSSSPLSGDPDLVPEDVSLLLEGWFSLAAESDVFLFLESVLANLEIPKQAPFLVAINAHLERGLSSQRFVGRKLVPIPSRSDIATLERALAACKAVGVAASEPEEHLLEALDRLATKPEPDRRGAIQAAIRAVESIAFALTGTRHLSLDDTLEELEHQRLIDGPLKAAYGGLFSYTTGRARTTSDDARLIVVMCAGFVTHLTARM
jgi:hypothetical protein